jgi:predicted small lipoprotein YifL
MQATVVRSTTRAVIAAVLLGLAVAACGRMGPLSLPPGATVDQAPKQRAYAPDGSPIIPPQQQKPLPMDWLLN